MVKKDKVDSSSVLGRPILFECLSESYNPPEN